mgnify:CR=1 FL=1
MISERNAPRLLGAAFLFVFFASLISGVLLTSVVGSGNVSHDLVSVSNQLTRVRVSILGQMLTSSGIVVLAVLLYIVLRRVNRILALVALGWWLAEAITLALIQLGMLALIPLSLDFVRAGAPGESFYQALGQFLYYGLARQGMTIHMWFYCIGGLLWYFMFFRSRYIPRVISLWGLIAVALALARPRPSFSAMPCRYGYPFRLRRSSWPLDSGSCSKA